MKTHTKGKNMVSYNSLPCYTENEMRQEAYKQWYNLKNGKEEKMSEKKKINWLGLVIEIVKAAVAFFAGTQVTI